jgi:acetyl-CoA C-acetyltransferase
VSPPTLDDDRLPVVVAFGQSIERDQLVTPVDLMARAAQAALAQAPALGARIQRLSVVDIMSRTGSAPAAELAARLGLVPAVTEVTTIGGNSPQWLVNRAAADIAAGRLSVTLIAGAEAIRSSRDRRHRGEPPALATSDLGPDPVVGDAQPGIGPAESAIGLVVPVHIYPLFESVVAARAGHSTPEHRAAIGHLFAPFTRVAAANPYAWFPQVLTSEEIATPSPENRVVSEPYTKRMTAFLGSDQGAALVVCSLAAARRAGVADRAVFIWSGAGATDVRFPSARPDPGRSPAIAAAGRALFEAAGRAAGAAGAAGAGGATGAGGSVGIDDIDVLDLYSCFPSAVELGADALGLALDDPRGLTVTGGLPYFGGPGNNYTTHGIGAVTDRLRKHSGSPARGLATGLGWFVTKHALGLYATEPPPGGFHLGDTTLAQQRIDASAVEVALGVDGPTDATVVAVTVVRDHDGSASAAPMIARLADGRQVAAAPADDQVAAAMGGLDTPTLVGTGVVVDGEPPRYRLPDD